MTLYLVKTELEKLIKTLTFIILRANRVELGWSGKY